MTRSIGVRVEGLAEIRAAFRDLPDDAKRELDQSTKELAQLLASFARAAGRADSRQSARAASTVRADTSGGTPRAVAGPHPLLFGSEFGSFSRWGWYEDDRYAGSPARQFRPHLGGGSYWFFRTQDEHGADIDSVFVQTCEAIIAAWGG